MTSATVPVFVDITPEKRADIRQRLLRARVEIVSRAVALGLLTDAQAATETDRLLMAETSQSKEKLQ